MRYFVLCIFLKCLSLVTFSQKNTLFGNFVFDNQVYQYQYKKDGTIHSLKLSTLSDESWLKNLDTARLNKVQVLFDTALKKNLLPVKVQDSIKWLPEFLKQLQNVVTNHTIWKANAKNIDSLINLLEQSNLSVVQELAEKNKVDNPIGLLKMYKAFLNMIKEPRQSKALPFSDLKEDVFLKVFQEELSQLYALDGKNISTDKNGDVIKKANEIMYEIRARAEFEDDEPVTAYLSLKRKHLIVEVPIYVKKGKCEIDSMPVEDVDDLTMAAIQKLCKVERKLIPVYFQVSNIQVEFEDGAIKHLLVDLLPQVNSYIDQYGQAPVRFRNLVPISVSGKFDPDFFSFQKIYAGNTRELMNAIKEEAERQLYGQEIFEQNFQNNNPGVYFNLSSILDYLIITESGNEDYSPANGKIELNENKTIVQLKKEKRSKIISARMYTDFAGMNADNPNGLVQIEISRKLNLISDRSSIKNEKKFTNPGKLIAYAGWLTYIEPIFSFNKIEENNRYYILDSLCMDKDKSFVDSQNYFRLNPIEVLRHMQVSMGLNTNIYKWSLINKKMNVQFNWYLGYGRVPIADSFKVTESKIRLVQNRNETSVNTVSFGPSLFLEFKPDSRWGVSFGTDMRWLEMKHPRFELDPEFSHISFTTWFDGHLKTNNNSKLFFRFRRHWLHKMSEYNFNQMQFGYEFDIFKAK